jgi:hypothetical protein
LLPGVIAEGCYLCANRLAGDVAIGVMGVGGACIGGQFVVGVYRAAGSVAGFVVAEAFLPGAGELIGGVVAVAGRCCIGGFAGDITDFVELVCAAAKRVAVLSGFDGRQPAVGVVAEVRGYVIGLSKIG